MSPAGNEKWPEILKSRQRNVYEASQSVISDVDFVNCVPHSLVCVGRINFNHTSKGKTFFITVYSAPAEGIRPRKSIFYGTLSCDLSTYFPSSFRTISDSPVKTSLTGQ